MGYFMCQLFEGSKARSLWKINGINEANDITLAPSLFQLGILTTKEVSCVREIWHLQCAPHCSKFFKKCAALSIVFFISKVAIYFAWKIFIPSLKHLSSAKKSYIDHDDQQNINCEIRTIFYTKSKAVYNVWWPMKTPFDLVQGADNDKVELLERLISLKNGTSAWGNFFVTPPPMCHFMSVPYSSHMCLSIRKHVHFFSKA